MQLQEIPAWRQELREGRARLRDLYLQKPRANWLLNAHARLVDDLLRKIWQHLDIPKELALLATGGYGRKKLFPYSDIDLLILLNIELDESTSHQIETLIGILWDIGLDVGHGVRTIAECLDEAEKDITVQTNLLETRLITGNRNLYRKFQTNIWNHLNIQAFFEAKSIEQQQRHLRYHDTAYNLEPNIKESPGGLRDIQTIFWIARAARIGTTWREFVEQGLLTEREALSASRRESFLNNLRIRLHYQVKRREDRLLFDYQNVLADLFNICSNGTCRPSEMFMRQYYRNAKNINMLNEILLLNLRGRIFSCIRQNMPIPINRRFQIVGNLLDIVDEHVFKRHPSAIFESILLLQKHPELQNMSAKTLRALWRAQEVMNAEFRRNEKHKNQFLSILTQQRGIIDAFRRLNRYGILGTYIPAFGRISCQMQHDLFHVYTVDEHILTVLRNLRRFALPEFSHEYPLCHRLMTSFTHPETLYLSALFHDIAKGRGGDHSDLGGHDAMTFCRAHKIAPEETKLIVWLVKNHLVMSMTAQKKDLSSPDVITEFADLVQNDRYLTALYLLTVADIRGTSPKVWNAWKAKLLEDLFFTTLKYLRKELVISEDKQLQSKKRSAEKILRLYIISPEQQQSFWSQLDSDYFLRHEPQEIAWHTRKLHYQSDQIVPIVICRLSPIGEGIQVLVYTPDQRDLFARICGFFERMQYNIVEAKIYTTRRGYALDSFLVLNSSGQNTHYRDAMSFIEFELKQKLMIQMPLERPLAGRMSRHLKHFPVVPEVSIRPSETNEKTGYSILSVTSGDRPGLLSRIAYILVQYGISVHNAKITTLGERAEDMFLIRGSALYDNKLLLRLQTDLIQQLQS